MNNRMVLFIKLLKHTQSAVTCSGPT